MITKGKTMPTEEELTIEEVPLSTPYLKAGAFHLGKQCEAVNNDYMLCKDEEKDPRKCLQVGKEVTKCSMDFFRKVKKNCADEFNDYARCLDFAGPEMDMWTCRNTQSIFDSCMFEKLKMVRPHFGYFSEVKIHSSSRPKPPPEPPLVYPDALPEVPSQDIPRQPGKYGARFFGVF